jgi:hypothetical protein
LAAGVVVAAVADSDVAVVNAMTHAASVRRQQQTELSQRFSVLLRIEMQGNKARMDD